MWLMAVCFLLVLGYGILIMWYRHAWTKLDVQKTEMPRHASQLAMVTVLVPARNEQANIARCLQSLIEQNYPTPLLEILVIDDQSEDETAAIVHEFAAKYPNIGLLKLVHQASQRSHKKKAIEAGVEMAKGSLILATDADCTQHPQWVFEMASAAANGNQFVAGPVMYHTKPTLLSIFQTLDFLSLQGITGASVSAQFHTMCNGANLAYTREAFKKVNGFEGIDQLPTGDDMLLMYKIYQLNPAGVTWLKNPGAMVTTHAAETWRAFFNQRIRWASKATHYDDKRIFWVLLLVYAVNVMLVITGVAAIFSLVWLKAWFLMMAFKTLVELWFLWPVACFFKKRNWLWAFALMQPLHLLYTVMAGWLGQFGQYEWKGRIIKK